MDHRGARDFIWMVPGWVGHTVPAGAVPTLRGRQSPLPAATPLSVWTVRRVPWSRLEYLTVLVVWLQPNEQNRSNLKLTLL